MGPAKVFGYIGSVFELWDFLWALIWSLPSLKGSELLAPILKLVYHGVLMGKDSELGAHTRGPQDLLWR